MKKIILLGLLTFGSCRSGGGGQQSIVDSSKINKGTEAPAKTSSKHEPCDQEKEVEMPKTEDGPKRQLLGKWVMYEGGKALEEYAFYPNDSCTERTLGDHASGDIDDFIYSINSEPCPGYSPATKADSSLYLYLDEGGGGIQCYEITALTDSYFVIQSSTRYAVMEYKKVK